MADTMNLQEILRIEESISDLLETARNDIIQEIDKTEIEGVERINNFCAVIKLSKLQNNVWSPEYYSTTPRIKRLSLKEYKTICETETRKKNLQQAIREIEAFGG